MTRKLAWRIIGIHHASRYTLQKKKKKKNLEWLLHPSCFASSSKLPNSMQLSRSQFHTIYYFNLPDMYHINPWHCPLGRSNSHDFLITEMATVPLPNLLLLRGLCSQLLQCFIYFSKVCDIFLQIYTLPRCLFSIFEGPRLYQYQSQHHHLSPSLPPDCNIRSWEGLHPAVHCRTALWCHWKAKRNHPGLQGTPPNHRVFFAEIRVPSPFRGLSETERCESLSQRIPHKQGYMLRRPGFCRWSFQANVGEFHSCCLQACE